ncbi:MAG: hypothetical protein WB611_24805 [Stellaceae bacterium]
MEAPPAGLDLGDWGPDDQLGRLNLLTPDQVLKGIAEVREGPGLLPEPAARLSRRHRQPAATRRG